MIFSVVYLVFFPISLLHCLIIIPLIQQRYISVCAGVGTSSVTPSHSPSLNSNNSNLIITKTAAYLCHIYHYITTHEYIIKCQLILLKYKKYVYRFLSLCTCVLSISILWSELVLSTSLHSPTGSLIGAYNSANIGSNNGSNKTSATDPNQAFFVQLITFITLAYMSLCTYWSLFRLNLGKYIYMSKSGRVSK